MSKVAFVIPLSLKPVNVEANNYTKRRNLNFKLQHSRNILNFKSNS